MKAALFIFSTLLAGALAQEAPAQDPADSAPDVVVGAAPEPAPTEAAHTEGEAEHTDEAGTGVLPLSYRTSGAENEDEDEAPETTKTRRVSTTTRDSDDVAVKTDVPGSAGRVAMGALLPIAGAVAAFAL
ncbi:unnamed protein product [Parascedosporium putredinis]|uniref:Uncharacterized protein n=1 Tax=Parascedosporium putredinis TaxID=1442378 RepID=A0A9P1GVK7_9PEZI|nr:unnamed protein product [Parascedosporium putredinis]CAI7987871.1 unnamed protein product [Parascedosporium putredinis]